MSQEKITKEDSKEDISRRTLSEESKSLRTAELSEQSLKRSNESMRKRLDKYTTKSKNAVGSVISIRKSSIQGEYFDKKNPRFANSYRMDSDNPFNPEKVYNILKSIMEQAFEDMVYEPSHAVYQAKWASHNIRNKVKDLEFDRYKIIAIVTIGERNSQDFLSTCRFLWDPERDRYSKFTLENTTTFGIAQCFGLYYE